MIQHSLNSHQFFLKSNAMSSMRFSTDLYMHASSTTGTSHSYVMNLPTRQLPLPLPHNQAQSPAGSAHFSSLQSVPSSPFPLPLFSSGPYKLFSERLRVSWPVSSPAHTATRLKLLKNNSDHVRPQLLALQCLPMASEQSLSCLDKYETFQHLISPPAFL